MTAGQNRVCPVEKAGSLDSRFRRWLQNPEKILAPYVKKAMTVLDLGCGPGFFSIDMARMVGRSGRLIACDLQEEMLRKLRNKIHGTELEQRIMLHRCEADRIGLSEKVDFVLAFYVIHEIADPQALFKQLSSILSPGGQVLVVEPPFHVSKSAFLQTIHMAREAGFQPGPGPKVAFSKTAILRFISWNNQPGCCEAHLWMDLLVQQTTPLSV